jgi:uncharacterized protein YjbI with pentapeptide repeats
LAFPTTSLIDNFDRADAGDLGVNWSYDWVGGGQASPDIVSNRCASPGGASSAWWNVVTFGPDCEVYVDVPVRGAGTIALLLRLVNPGGASVTGFQFYIDAANSWQLWRSDGGGSFTQIGTGTTQVVSNGDAVGIEAIGDTFKAYYKAAAGSWVEVWTKIDATYATQVGRIGLELNTSGSLDNFSGGTRAGAQVYRGTRDFERKASFPFMPMARWKVGGTSGGNTLYNNRVTAIGAGGPAPYSSFERFLAPRLHPVIVTPGVTYEPTGSLTAGANLSGADVWEHGEAGSLLAGGLLSGADVFEHVEAGSLLAGMSLSGADVAEHAEAGSLTPDTTLAGSDVFEHVESGALIAGTNLSGADVFTAAETGSLITQAFLAGLATRTALKTGSLTTGVVLAGADAFTASETGALFTAVLLSGTDATTHAESGSLVAGVFLSGADVSTYAESGSLATQAFLSGVAVKVVSGLYQKTGSLTAATQGRGADVFTAVETGALLAKALVSGASFKIASVTYLKSGSLVIGVQLRGADVFIATEAGSVVARALLAGLSSYLPAIAPTIPASSSVTDSEGPTVMVADLQATVVAVLDEESGADAEVEDWHLFA